MFAYGFWLRTTSLEALPEVNGDEVWHAIQLTRLMRGEPFSLLTESSLPLSPFHSTLEMPFLLTCNPSLWVVRLPALMTGILAVVLVYVLGSRMLDRTTALIAAALMAVLPAAIIFSRVSYDVSHSPLYAIVIIYLAHRLRITAVVVMLSLTYFIHPTNIFLLPVLVAVVLVRSLEESPEDPARGRRLMLARVAAMTAVVGAIGVFAMLRSDTKRLSQAFDAGLRGRHDFLEFWQNYERLFLGCHNHPAPLRSWLFWTVLLLTLGFGLWRLLSSRRWDRVAFVVGPILAALGLFVMGGSNFIMPSSARYGLFLVTPTCLGVACLVNALLVDREVVRLAGLRYLQFGGILALGWCLLLSVDLTHINKWSVISPEYRNNNETPWTFGTDTRPPLRQVYSLILRDLEAAKARRASTGTGGGPQDPGQPTSVVTHSWWEYGPIEWLATPRRDIKVTDFDYLPDDAEKRFAVVRDCLHRGGYVVAFASNPGMSRVVQILFPAESLKQWDIPQSNGQPYVTLYRLKWNAQVANDAGGVQLGRVEPRGDRREDLRTIK